MILTCKFDGADLQNLGAETGQFQHLFKGDALKQARVFHYPRIGSVNSFHIGINLALICFQSRRQGNGRGIRSSPAKGSNAAEQPGLVPDSEWKQRRFGEPWIKGETVSVAIGQGFNLWTPIQLASVYAALGNGGVRYRPFIVKRIEDPYGNVIRETQPAVVGTLPFSGASITRVRRALRGVVHEPHGTGWIMRRLGGSIEAAGKTGTAQVIAMAKNPPPDEEDIPEEHRDHAWFVTYVPADNPRIVVAVLAEHGGHGSSGAAPIALAVVKEFLEHEAEVYARR